MKYVQLLAQLIKAVEEMNLGNYEQVVSYSWLIIEAYLYRIYYTNKSRYSQAIGDENLSSLEVINGLKGMKALPYEIVGELHELRKIRNQIIHSQYKDVTMAQAQLSIEVIREFIKRDTAVDIRLMF
ncbi:hypothetical protein HC766_01505 [Candidatus Gracilibacteria bacterium]|nr:hypothetical protein [Candidatus Gracilibacteria bacterium]